MTLKSILENDLTDQRKKAWETTKTLIAYRDIFLY